MKILMARLALITSLLVPIYFAVAALGVKFGLFDWRIGLGVMIAQWGIWVIGAALVLAVLVLVIVMARPPRRGWSLALIAILIPAVALGYLAWVREKSATIPPIHDVATNPDDAPVFSGKVMALRAAVPDVNPVNSLTEPLSTFEMYKGERFAPISGKSAGEIARAAYPDVRTLRVKPGVAETFAAVLAEANGAGWEVVTSESGAGVIEAIATSFWFGFRDDIAIRIRPAAGGSGSDIDMRSTSRVGVSDLGANAARIKAFLEAVRARVGS
jgi:hypothetical protein